MRASRPARSRRALLPALLLLLLAAGCASSSERREDGAARVEELIRRQQYAEAVELAHQLAAEDPGAPELEDLHRRASAAWYLAAARQATFADEDDRALELLDLALAQQPGSEAIRTWIDKTELKLAERWREVALEHYANGQLDDAIDAYQKSLEYVPGYLGALRGLAETTLLMNHRLGLGDDYYGDGVTALNEYWLLRARRDFAATQKYAPENARADRRRTESEEQLSEQRVAIAQQLEAEGLYHAAWREFGLALALNPDNSEAGAGHERTQPEAQAARLLSEADMLTRRERYEDALTCIAEAEARTARQTERAAAAREAIADSRLATLYGDALNLERDQQFPAAIEAYEKLFEFTDYYKDARTRQETLREYVRLAAEYYERAMAAETPAERLDLLRAIRGFWSEYRDVTEQVEALEAELPPEPDEA